ncbi:MAG: hypothetical protein AAFV85_23270 [Cyanobacteria bacterium J06634_6]
MTYKTLINDFTTNDAVIEAVAVGVTLYRLARTAGQDAIDSGAIARQWWDGQGQEYALTAARGVALAVFTLTCLACAVGFALISAAKAVEATWVKYGTLDGDGPVWGKTVESPDSGSTDAATTELIDWCIQRWPQLA